eukprot:Nitzschia sp. Nitz4//scaffold120_size68122//47760//50556//NITZ4_006052-RA/size68122-augustus-gene-0.59-mRNA-1//-1//CDS//3329534302//1509//frame0
MSSGSEYVAAVYEAPRVVEIVGSILRAPRGQYSTNFTDVFSSERDEQLQYVHGLLAMMVAFMVLFIFWAFVLCVFKFKGQEVGCASGRAFLVFRDDEDNIPVTDESESYSSSGGYPHPDSFDSRGTDEQKNQPETPKSPKYTKEELFHDGDSYDSHPEEILDLDRAPLIAHRREKRTRLCFLVASLLALICVPIIMVRTYAPLKDATVSSKTTVLSADEVLSLLANAVDSIDNATQSAVSSVNSANLDLDVVCPNVDADQIEAVVGMDLNDIITIVTTDFESVVAESESELLFYRDYLQSLQEGVDAFEVTVEEAQGWLWIIPGVLIMVALVATVALVAVGFAWNGQPGNGADNILLYFFLPLLTFLVVCCWVLVAVTALGAMMGSDVCTAGERGGSPDDTIQQVLGILDMDKDSLKYTMITAYTNECSGTSPTADIDAFTLIVQEAIDSIWRQVSIVGSIGSDEIMVQCGSTELLKLLETAREVAALLTSIRKALESTSSVLDCSNINPLYNAAAHDALCTDAAGAAASGFLWFLVLTCTLMVMLSLRAAWLHSVEEEKVYHDETEMAENMIVDEHEEYLAYISRYKHEWQEYNGFEERSRSQYEDEDDSYYFEDDEDRSHSEEGEGYNGSDEGSYIGSDYSPETPSGIQVEIEPIMHGEKGMETSDVTFGSSKSPMAENLGHLSPQISLPPARNPSHLTDGPESPIFVHATLVQDASAPSEQTQEPKPFSFFDHYGITAGGDGKQKDPPAATEENVATKGDDGDGDDSTIESKTAGMVAEESIPMQEERASIAHKMRGNTLKTRGALPSGRTFFKAKTTGETEDVELQLSTRPGSSSSSFSQHSNSSEDYAEC